MITIFTTIFYIMSIIFISIELGFLLAPIDQTDKSRKFFELSRQFKNKKWDDISEEYQTILKSKIWLFFSLIWFFIGLFTSQWILFLIILLFNVIIIGPISTFTRFSYVYTVIHWINSLIGLLFGIFVIINHYHLKINLTEYFISLFN